MNNEKKQQQDKEEADIRSLQQELKQAQNNKEERNMKRFVENTTKEIEENQKSINDIKGQLEKWKRGNEESDQEYKEEVLELKKYENELIAKEEAYSLLKKEYEKLSLDKDEEETLQMREEVEKETSMMKTMEEKLKNMTNQLDALRERNESLNRDNEENSIDMIKKRIEETQKEINTQIEYKMKLKREMEEKCNTLYVDEYSETSLQNALQKNNTQLDQIQKQQEEWKDMQEKNTQLTERMNTVHQHIHTSNERLNQLKEEKENIQQSIESLNQEKNIHSNNEELTLLESTIKKMKEDHAKTLTKVDPDYNLYID